MKWLDGITDSTDVHLSKLEDRKAWHAAVHGVMSWTQHDRTPANILANS